METIKSFASFLPFLEQYPIWVKVLFAAWIILSAVLLASFVLAPHRSGNTNLQPSPVSVTTDFYLEISKPQMNAKVGRTVTVSGSANISDRYLYLVVIPMNTGDRFIVDGPLATDSKGKWSGRARFGEHELGRGERFSIHAMLTNSRLREGPLPSLPADAFNSSYIEVWRTE